MKLSDHATANNETFDQSLKRNEFELKKELAQKITALFIYSNSVVLFLLAIVFVVDQWLEPSDRIITTEVIMALVGATTVQLGVIMLTIMKSLFPTKK